MSSFVSRTVNRRDDHRARGAAFHSAPDEVDALPSSNQGQSDAQISNRNTRMEELRLRLRYELDAISELRNFLAAKKNILYQRQNSAVTENVGNDLSLTERQQGDQSWRPGQQQSDYGQFTPPPQGGRKVIVRKARMLKCGKLQIAIHRARGLPSLDLANPRPPSTFVEARIVSIPPSPNSTTFDPWVQAIGPPGKTRILRNSADPVFDSVIYMDMTDFDASKLHLFLLIVNFSDDGDDQPLGFVHLPLSWVTEPSYGRHLPQAYDLQPCSYLRNGLPWGKLRDSRLYVDIRFTSLPLHGNEQAGCAANVLEEVPASQKAPTTSTGSIYSHVAVDTRDLMTDAVCDVYEGASAPCQKCGKTPTAGPRSHKAAAEPSCGWCEQLTARSPSLGGGSQMHRGLPDKQQPVTRADSDVGPATSPTMTFKSDEPLVKDSQTAHICTIRLNSARNLPLPEFAGAIMHIFAEIRIVKKFKKQKETIEDSATEDFFREEHLNTVRGCFVESRAVEGSAAAVWNQTFQLRIPKDELVRLNERSAGDLILQIRLFNRRMMHDNQPIGDVRMSLRTVVNSRNDSDFRMSPSPFGIRRHGLVSARLNVNFAIV